MTYSRCLLIGFLVYYVSTLILSPPVVHAAERPNILWLTCEDMSPNLGCYGDSYATTPNLDALAARGLRYINASSNAPVCAPARTTIISGLYPPSTGAEHMRSLVKLPEQFCFFPKLLRDAGYYTTNNSKEDYNLEATGKTWDESSNRAHWKNRRNDQPFFAVFNFTITHESQLRNEIAKADRVHDPATVHLPAYHPDRPEVRRDWAQYYDRITMMDKQVGAAIEELEQAGLADNTIVFFFADHGSGMPRSKRSACNSGLNVPLIAHFPPKWQHLAPNGYRDGSSSDRLVSFVDLAPSMLSLAGIQSPNWMQGAAFCGRDAAPEPEFSYGFRGRMDERYDLVRSVRNKRFMYVRNYMPHRPHGQHNAYMFETPTTRVWKQLFDTGKLNSVQSQFWQPKAVEELYDLAADRDEVRNLAEAPEYQGDLTRLRNALADWEKRFKDVGFLPESEMRDRLRGSTPYDMGHDPQRYDSNAVYAAANLATSLRPDDLPKTVALLKNADSGIRYWGAVGLLAQGRAGVAAGHDALVAALDDRSPVVQIMAAESLGRYGNKQDLEKALSVLLTHAQSTADAYVAVAAWNALDELDDRAATIEPQLKALSPDPVNPPPRYGEYGHRLKAQTLADLEAGRAARLMSEGKFSEAERLLKSQIAHPDAPIVAGPAVQLEVLRRTRLDFPWTNEQVLAEIKKSVPDATPKDVDRWREAGDLQYRLIDGQPRFFTRAVSNLFRFNAEARGRQVNREPGKKFNVPALLEKLVNLSEQSDDPQVYPVKHHIQYEVAVKPGNPRVKPGAKVRAWLPFPQEYRQQHDVKLLGSSPRGTHVASKAAPQRSIYFEQTITDAAQTPRFAVEFEFITEAYCRKLDPAKVKPYDVTGSLYREFTAERRPHIMFTPDVLQLSKEIVGDEQNPLEKARRIFRWVSKNIPWCAELEYSIIPSLSVKGLTARRGDCGVQGTCFITLCRAAGVPARWQSGWQTKPGDWNMHDWSEIYIEPWGWLPVDASNGVQNHADPRVRDFYCGHLDPYRLIVNLDYGRELEPPKTSFRSEPIDFQRGEIEIDGHNLYFNEWSWKFEVETVPLDKAKI